MHADWLKIVFLSNNEVISSRFLSDTFFIILCLANSFICMISECIYLSLE